MAIHFSLERYRIIESSTFFERQMKYFAKSSFGQDLYWIELFDAGMDRYFFDSSLEFDLHQYPKLKKLIRIICDKNIPGKTQKMFIKKLFIEIEKVKDVREYFFKAYQVDKYGQYKDGLKFSLGTLMKELTPGSPYTATSNAEVFYEMRNAFNEIRFSNSLIAISKEMFERKLKTDKLKDEYVNAYCSEARYFQMKANNGEDDSSIYIMTDKEEKLRFLLCSPMKK